MARFNIEIIRPTPSTSLDAGCVCCAAASPRRFEIYDITIGYDGTPADTAARIELQKRTAFDTGSAVTPQPIDDADTLASTLQACQIATVNGAGSGVKWMATFNQRSTVRWFATVPGDEIKTAATASSGVGVASPVTSVTASVDLAVNLRVNEY